VSEPKRWWACECDLNEQPSEIAYEREYQLELVEAKDLAALRATIAQQAQELERVKERVKELEEDWRLEVRLHDQTKAALAAQRANNKEGA
jgi:hypothetical protein